METSAAGLQKLAQAEDVPDVPVGCPLTPDESALVRAQRFYTKQRDFPTFPFTQEGLWFDPSCVFILFRHKRSSSGSPHTSASEPDEFDDARRNTSPKHKQILETLSVGEINYRRHAAVVIKPVSADSLCKTGIFPDTDGDFRRFQH